ncbi:hypothetical protein H3V11_08185 [Snodgrassella sp. W8158]|uniref:hypothetical protein n=1 Tax=Snodgrassella sp. W8158 TaxID=2751018 RepID=UPI0018DB5D45|nr:hypothetical protein [Snodgrassella sp. W8158]MBI0181917.1 hypothetical protein [Snodgrassella sp. W8158]
MTKKYNIFNHKPAQDEFIYLPCFVTSGGYRRTKWDHNDKDHCNSKTVIFKDWKSAQAATNFLLDYIKDNPNRFPCLKIDHRCPTYILKMGHLSGMSVQRQPSPAYNTIEYLLESGLIYRTEKEALEAKKELEEALYSEVLRSNPGFVFSSYHPLEDTSFFVPDSYSGTVKTIYFDSDNPDHNNLLDRNLLFTDLEAAEEVLQTWLALPVLNNNSQLKED